MPRRALAFLLEIARRGAAGTTAWMQEVGQCRSNCRCRTLPEGQGCPFWQTPIKTTERRKQAASGGFLLDTYLCGKLLLHFPHSPRPCGLSAQRKVSRPWVREPTLKKRRVSDTLLCSSFDKLPSTSSGRTFIIY